MRVACFAPVLLSTVLSLSGCVSTVCGDDLLNCKGRCEIAQECKPECKHSTCKDACKQLYIRSCRSLAVHYTHGVGVEGNEAKAAELFKFACDNDDSLGCTHLGFMYETGNGVRPDPQKALEYYKIGCKDHVAVACLGKERIEDELNPPAEEATAPAATK